MLHEQNNCHLVRLHHVAQLVEFVDCRTFLLEAHIHRGNAKVFAKINREHLSLRNLMINSSFSIKRL